MAEKTNAEAVGGFSDWVLPDADTLKALYQVCDRKGEWFWSSSPFEDSRDRAYAIGFSNECIVIGHGKKLSYTLVRLVRAGQMFDIGRAGQLESMREAGIMVP